ncbi:MAG: bifunctional nicotinamidase/pyrazinamidase [Cyclobacteriaceae bacterium]
MEALILVDIQRDFLPGGALAVNDGDTVVPVANTLQPYFDLIVATQDYHPADHLSFAANHSEKQPGDLVQLKGLKQVLWPVHCVQGATGAQFADNLSMDRVAKIFPKGTDPEIDSYSGFFDNGHLKATGLGDYLKEKGVDKVVVMGLATDYCVKFTALDAKQLGFTTVVIGDGTRAVNLQPDDFDKAIAEMKAAGIQILSSEEFVAKQKEKASRS